jgi:fibronectin-binding autotransporter adhesin
MKIIRTQKSNFISATLRMGLVSLLLVGAAANSRAAGASTLTATDAAGSSSFNAVGHWSGGMAPGPGTNFFTGAFTLRTPVAAGNYTFLGDSLTIGTGGSLAIKGGSGNIITLNNLTNSGTISDAINANTIAAVTGNMVVVNGAAFNTSTASGDVRTITNGLTMSGTGTVTNTSSGGAFPGTVVYTANNTAFTGPLIVNNNQTVQTASVNNLGGNPASFNPAQLLLNNGTLQPSASFTMNNANSGISLGVSNGTFNVGSGVTLTVVNPITGPGSLTKSGLGTVILSGSNSYTNGTVVNGGILGVQNGFGLGTNGSVNQASGARNATITLQGGITIPAAVGFILSNDGLGTNLLTTNAIENIGGDNTINGTITLTIGGGNAAIQSDGGALVINGGVRIATGQTSRGVNLQGVSTAANAINGPITDLSSTSLNSVTKNDTGNWALSGTNTYSGLTLINGGTLAVTGGGSISNTPLISIAAGAILDVSGMTSAFTLGAVQSISNSVGTVNGSMATAAGATICPASVGVAGTLTCGADLNLGAGGTAYFDLSTTASSGNDQIVVGGNLTLSSSDYVHINAMSGALDTSDYVLFSVGTGTTMSTTPVLIWDGLIPGNYLNYSLVKSGNNVVLHYSASTAPSVTALVTPASVSRNQTAAVTANVTKGSGNIVSVTVDLSPIGGSATAGLILDNVDSTPPTYIYTNTFFVSAGTSVGNKSLTVTAADDSSPAPLSGTYVITPLTIAASNATWDGGASDDKWTSNTNWTSDIGPGLIGDSATFSGTTRLTPDMNTNYSLTGVTFDATAGAFTIGGSGSTLTNGNGGIVNNSSSAQTLNVALVNSAAQTFNASAGNLTLNANITLGGNTLTVDGAANTSISGVISGTAGIAKNGSGTLLLSGVNTYGNNGASDTSVNFGALAIGNDQALGSSRLNFGDGGILESADGSAHIITNRLNFGSGAGGNVVFGGTGNLKLTGAANNGSDKILTINNPQTELSGGMSGASGRTVSGTGILILSSANTYSSFTTINPGATLQLGNGGTNGSLATSSAIDVEGTLIFDRSDALAQGTQFSGAPITGGGSIVQAGSGTTTLNAANTYSGSATVNNGELFITPAYQAGGNVSVANDARFGVSANSVSSSATIGNLTLGSGGLTTLDFSYGFAGNPTNVALSAGAVTISGTCAVRVGGAFVVGTFPVLKYSSLSGTFSATVAAPRGVTATLSNDTVNGVINVTISSVGSGIVWTGTNSLASNLWDLNTTTNWLIGGQPTFYIENVPPPGDAVIFNDSGSGTVLLSNTVNPASITFSNSAVNYTLQGSGQINSSASLTKVGAGSITLNVPGNFISSTFISNGTVKIGANQTFANLSGNSAVTASAGAPTLTVNDNLSTTFAGGLSGSLGLTKVGSGTLTLISSNSFSGNLFVSLGGLTLDSGVINAGNFCSIGHVGTDNGALTLKGIAAFTTTSDFNVGDVGSSVGTFNIQGTAGLTANAMYIGSANAAGSTASGTVNQTGGTVTELSTTAGTFSIGGRASGTSVGATGTYNLSGGTLTAASAIRVGSVGVGSFNQISGTVVANAGVDIATVAGASGTYEFDGGTLRTLNVTSSSAGNSTMYLNGGVLIPTANNNNFVTNVSQVYVRDGGVVVDTTNFNVTIGSTLQHSSIGGDNPIDGGLTKRGNGTLTLAGTSSSYTGPTTVTGGALNLGANSVTSLNNLTVSNATLGLGLNGAASFSAANVTLVGNSTLNFYYDPVSGTPATALNVGGSLAASGTTTINVFGYGWTVGQFTLVDYTGPALANLNNFPLGALPYGVNASLSNNVANSSIDLVVTDVGIATWIPLIATDVLGASSFAAAGNWQDGNPPTAGNGYFTRTSALRSPADANTYTFGGTVLSVDSGGRFIMKGTNGQVMTVNNLIINGGLVDYANAADSFTETLAGNITLQAGILSYMGALGSANLSETLFETAPIGGSGNLQFGGPAVNGGTDLGVVVLAATNTYTGTTTVTSGTLLVNGANGNSPITVNANATLGGTGIIGGTINVQGGGNLAPGIAARGALTNVIGTLTAGNAASVSGAVAMKINRDASPNSDKFVAPGVTVNSGATLTVANIGSPNFVAGDTFALFSTPISGAFSTVTLPALPATNLFWTNNLAVNGTISVVSAVSVNPTPPPIAFNVGGGTLTLSWPQDHTGWILQVQTNSPGVGLGTNWVAVPGSTATNAVSIPINANSGSAFYRLKL